MSFINLCVLLIFCEGSDTSKGRNDIRMFFFTTQKIHILVSEIRIQYLKIEKNPKKKFNFCFEIIFRPEKIMFFRWDFFKSSSPDSGESFGSDFRTIPAV